MTVLVTGAGLVGSLAANRLIDDYDEQVVIYDVAFSMDNLRERVPLDQVTLVRGDINDLPDLIRTIQQHRVNRIAHTAAFLTWMVRERPYAGVRVNFMGTLSVLEAARLTGVERVVLCSSNTVSLGLKGPFSYDKVPDDFPLRTISEYPPSVYASMKLAAEWLGHCYRGEYGVDFAAVRFGGVFGPWRGVPSGGPSQTMQNLIENTWRGEPVSVAESELNRPLDYVYAADAAQAAVRALMAERLPSLPVFTAAIGRSYVIPELVELVEEYSGLKVKLDIRPGKSTSGYEDSKVPPGDTSRTEQELGWKLEYPMDRAIRDYLGWMERRG